MDIKTTRSTFDRASNRHEFVFTRVKNVFIPALVNHIFCWLLFLSTISVVQVNDRDTSDVGQMESKLLPTTDR